ncbi:MAG: Dipeptidyl aminopeptidase/acylaminoacyl-peptidase-like protein [Chloroflexi bacterium]|nr:Dipeptidyl aminopeptidase/acylaminoacyl-peptidase-like protein [Chloroflexota bacterium]
MAGRSRPMMTLWAARAFLGLICLLVALYLGLSAYMTTIATVATRRPVVGTPTDVGLAFEPVIMQTADRLALKGWLLPSSPERAVIMVHGLDVNRWDNGQGWHEVTKAYIESGFTVLLFDLRAHGESGGDRLGLGWDERQDVLAGVAFLRNRGFKPGRIGLYGASYGAGTALLAAAQAPEVGAVVADSPYADQREILSREITRRTGFPPIFAPGIALMARPLLGLDLAGIPPLLAVSQIAPRPILFIHGEADARIPYQNSERLIAAANNPINELWIVKGAAHADSYSLLKDDYTNRIVGFFGRYLRDAQ